MKEERKEDFAADDATPPRSRISLDGDKVPQNDLLDKHATLASAYEARERAELAFYVAEAQLDAERRRRIDVLPGESEPEPLHSRFVAARERYRLAHARVERMRRR